MISAASEHAAAEILRRSGTVAGTGCIPHPPTLRGQEVSGMVCNFWLLSFMLRFNRDRVLGLCDGNRPEVFPGHGRGPTLFLNDVLERR